MHLYLTDTEYLTLRDVLRTAGLRDRQIEDVVLLLSFKRERVQRVFYLRAIGWTLQEIGDCVGVSKQHIGKVLSNGLSEIRLYLSTISVYNW